MRIGGIVLAAGASRRAGCEKALATVDGEPMVSRAVRILREGGCEDVVVVVGPPHGERVAAAAPDAWIARNPDPSRGMLSSLKAALELADAAEWDAAVVGLVDQPHVEPATVRALHDAFAEAGTELVQPAFDGRRGHPYLVAREVFALLAEGSDEVGARPVLADLGCTVVQVDDPGIVEDLDTPEDMRAAGAVAP